MSPGFSLCTKPLLSLLVLQHFAFPTFWEFERDNSRYFLMNHNKLDSSSAGLGPVQMESCTSWDYNLQFYFLEGGSFPSMWSAEQCYAKQWNRNSGLGYRRTLEEVDRTLKNSLLGILRISFSPQVFLRSHSF